MSKSRFDPLNAFIRRWHRGVIVAWIIIVIAALFLIPSFFRAVSYDVTGSFGGPSNSESQKTSAILQAQFPGSSNESFDSILVVLQGGQVFSDSVRNAVLALDNSVQKDSGVMNYTGMQSVYSLEYTLLNSSMPSIVPQVAILEQNIAIMDQGFNTLLQGVNQTAQLVYGVPGVFVQVWQDIVEQMQNQSGSVDYYLANAEANATVYSLTSNFGGNPESVGYYSVFFPVWNGTFQMLPNATPVVDREALAVNQSVSMFLSNAGLDAQTTQMVNAVASGLNVTDWNENEAVANLSEQMFAQTIPSNLTQSLGLSPIDVAHSLYSLGASPSYSQLWSFSSGIIAESTQAAFLQSPVFSVNGTSLAGFLSVLQNLTSANLDDAIRNVVANQSFLDYPYLASSSTLKNFVSQDNGSMLIVLGFSSAPDSSTISRVKSDVNDSGLANFGTVYLTGGAVVTRDVQDVFEPALTLTVGPGVIFALLIVGLLFMSPVAAFVPVLMGGISTEISLAAIYFAVVGVGHGNITFLTPTLTVLLTLGLSVDYAVLQLRRTREERRLGKPVEESVAISVRWAGQAVLTAGITVITAYIVMALANVPIFSDVATGIALAVGILLAVSLTLLPSLELALGDRIFWPRSRSSAREHEGNSRLRRMATGVLRRKVLVVAVISLLALGAFYVEYSTPTGLDFLRLIPNFQSNQGITVVTNSFGSGTVSPTTIVVTTPTMITYGSNQLNMTLLDQIERVSNAVSSSSGTVSVSGPTRPFGSVFNYSGLSSLSEPLMLQYVGGMLSFVGKDNKTARINVGLSVASESPQAVSYLNGIKTNVNNVILINGVAVDFGGSTQSTYDSQVFLAGLLPEVVAILSLAVYVILFFQLRSAFTPIRLIFTILCSVVFSLALLSFVFYTLLNLPILDFAPLFVVVTMLGVGIDYDIFFVTRIREEALNGKSDDEAIKTAVDRVWVTILGLGLVLSVVFASLLITGIAILQEISLTVSAAILLDVLVVIPFFVPSLMGLAQRFNWWPAKIHRSKIEAEDHADLRAE